MGAHPEKKVRNKNTSYRLTGQDMCIHFINACEQYRDQEKTFPLTSQEGGVSGPIDNEYRKRFLNETLNIHVNHGRRC